ncbi:MAG: tetratricopeptide repeat protein [Candidatus Cloacimonetes bacterium]|nr:tetratricopeptide repeat protein [Candidatus Cloacimonadota bacterium]
MLKKTLLFLSFFLLTISYLISSSITYEINKAKKEIKNNNYQTAETILKELIPKTDDKKYLAEVYLLLTQCAEISEEAIIYYKKIINLSDNYLIEKAKFELAQIYFCNKEYNNAEDLFAQILQQTSSQYLKESLYWIAQTCFCKKDYLNSIDYFNRYIALGNDEVKLELSMLNIGTAYFNMNIHSSAIEEYENLEESHLNKNFTPFLLYKLGVSYENLSKYTEAIDCYKEVINQYPYSQQRLLAESKIVNLVEKGFYTSSLKMPEINSYMNKKYIVQLAAFLNKEQAGKSKAEFLQKGYDTFIYEKVVKGKNYFAVGLGPYKTKTEAQYIQNKLKKNSISSFIYKKP